MDRILQTLAAAALVSAAALTPVASQDDDASDVAGDPCVAGQDDKGGENNADTAADAQSLTEKLDRCGSVLEPPAVGDKELIEPAPGVGTTPIIPPSALPDEQPPEENGD